MGDNEVNVVQFVQLTHEQYMELMEIEILKEQISASANELYANELQSLRLAAEKSDLNQFATIQETEE